MRHDAPRARAGTGRQPLLAFLRGPAADSPDVQRVLAPFYAAVALTPDRAIVIPTPRSHADARLLSQLLVRGVLREVAGGRAFLDTSALTSDAERVAQATRLAAIVTVIVLLFLAWWTVSQL